MADSGTFDPETLANRQRIADQLLLQATKPREIRSPLQGLGQMGEAAIAGILSGLDDRERKQGSKAQADAIASLLSGGGAAPAGMPAAAPMAPSDQAPPTQSAAAPPPTSDFMPNVGSLPPGQNPAPMDANAKAIAGIESGGAYDKLGPMTKGDRAYGKYQVMGANVPAWTKAHLGREMTPDQFLADPAAQDAVFKGQFGQYASKYGPEGAARAWFAGEGGMNDPNRKDILGTSVADYAAKFNKGVGAQPTPQASPVAAALAQPQQVAQNAPAAAPGASPMAEKIAKMLNDPNPYVRKTGMALGQGLIQKQLEGDKPTDEMREYQLYRQQGGKDSFFDYKSGLKKAGAQNITIDQKGQTSFEQEAGKVQAKRFDELAAEAPKAKQMISDVQTLTDLGKNIGTGKGAQVKAALGPYADALGIKIDGLDDIQAFEAIVNRVAPSLRVPGSGAQSDYELKNFLKSLPNLGNTEGGNEIASAVMQGLYQNKVKAAEIGSQALTGEISRPAAEKMLRELPDPLEQYREFMKKNRGGETPAAGKATIRKFNPTTGKI